VGPLSFYLQTVQRLTFITPQGTEIPLRDDKWDGQPLGTGCTTGTSRGTAFSSTDSSGLKFIADTDISDAAQAVTNFEILSYPTGNLMWPDGTRYRIVNGRVSSIRDRNGNLISFQYDVSGFLATVTDSLNRTIQVTNHFSTGGSHDTITYKGFGGAQRTVDISFALLSNSLYPGETPQTYSQLFPQLNGSPTFTYDEEVVSSVTLPNGRSYRFQYNHFGEPRRVVLPTGAAVEYIFVEGATNVPNSSGVITDGTSYAIYRRVGERRVLDDGTSTTSRTVFTASYSGSTTDDYQTVVVEETFDTNNNRQSHAEHYYFGNPSVIAAYRPNPILFQGTTGNWGYSSWMEGLEFHTSRMDKDGITLLRGAHYEWAARAPAAWWTGATSAMPSRDPRLLATHTYLDNGLTSQQVYRYDQFNNVTDIREYDFGSGSPGPSLRHTIRNYVTSENGADYTSDAIHILNLPNDEIVYQVDPTSGAEQEAAKTFFFQDETAPLDRPNIVNLDSGYTSSYRPRGNLTTIWRFVIPGNQPLVTHYSYDVAGNQTSVTNPRGFTTRYDYTDRFGSPTGSTADTSAPSELSGQTSYAFKTCSTNALGHTTQQQYDFYTGQVVDQQDSNGTVSSYSYNDPLDRITQITEAANRSAKSQSTIAYDDARRTLIRRSDQLQFGDNQFHTETTTDGFGRVIETRQYENSSSFISTKTQYDALGRIQLKFNPARQGDPIVFSTTTYDGIDRPTTFLSQDSSTTLTTYSGNQTTVRDPALKVTRTVTDGLGRTVQVTEDPSGLNYVTSYSYDALDSAVTITQGAEVRHLTYDSLKRLIQLSDPETGTTVFGYDADNNLASREDSRNITTTYSYDALDRLKQKAYSDGTPTATYTYDDPAVSNSVGHLTATSSSVSSMAVTAFDALGRPSASVQRIDGQAYFMSYGYDASGELVSEVYPSGRIINYLYDGAGRVRDLSGFVNSQLPYASAIQYAPHGAIQQLTLGNGLIQQNTYNNQLQPIQLNLGTATNPMSVVGLSYTFSAQGIGNNGNVLAHSILLPGVAQPITQEFTYDGANRMSAAWEVAGTVQSWGQNYAYDRFGNRAVLNGSLIPSPAMTPQSLSAFNAKNQNVGFGYDAAGNLATDGFRSMAYDAENRQIRAQVPAYGTLSYSYDGDGQRVKQTANGTITVYVGDVFGQTVAEYSNSAPVQTTEYLQTDHIGNLRVVTDAFGALKARHDYLPFGEELDSSISGRNSVGGYGGNDALRLRFTGNERDIESGFDYFRSRYYSSTQGRFQSPDPRYVPTRITDPQSWNRYSYARTNPLAFVDSDGRSWQSFLSNSQKYNPLNILFGHAVSDITIGIKAGDPLAVASGVTEVVQNTANVITTAADIGFGLGIGKSLLQSGLLYITEHPTATAEVSLKEFVAGGKTNALLRTIQGDTELISGFDGPASSMPSRSPGFDIITRSHVEGHAAALLQQQNINEGTLFINNPTICSSCSRLLPRMLPSGTMLNVVLPDGTVVPFAGR